MAKINALTELKTILKEIGNPNIKAGKINHEVCGTVLKTISLKVNHSDEELENFFRELSTINYDNGFGSSELDDSFIWFDDGRWLERKERDGSEWWSCPRAPKIPEHLL